MTVPPRVRLRAPVSADLAGFVTAVRASRRLHRPWVAPPDDAARFHQWVAHVGQPGQAAFLVCLPDGGLAGVFQLSEIVRGSFQSAYLGYYALTPHAGQGLMRAGLQALLKHAFQRMKLHRVEANIQPGNAASLALVRGAGFRLEGYSPRYLKIGGRWRDHERWARLADDR
jgi:[ribosomal protein S5]-alanine N-acetyltransferase